jgi:hypothetical protein
MKISKFLMAENPINSEDLKEYILHTENPRFLAEVIEGKLGYQFYIVQEYDGAIEDVDLEELKLEMLDWWNEYLDWEEKLEEGEE